MSVRDLQLGLKVRWGGPPKAPSLLEFTERLVGGCCRASEIFWNKFKPLNTCAPSLCQTLCVYVEESVKSSLWWTQYLQNQFLNCFFKPRRTACQVSIISYTLLFEFFIFSKLSPPPFFNQTWCLTPLVPIIGRQKQVDFVATASQSPCFKRQQNLIFFLNEKLKSNFM